MLYPNIASRFFDQPLLLLPQKAEEIASFLRRKINGETIPEAEVRAAVAQRRPKASAAGDVALIEVAGVLGPRVSNIEKASGGIGCDEIGQQLDRAVADPRCKTIVLAFDSPGGAVAGVPELGQKIRAARARKPVIASCDPTSASAAFWLAGQATEVCATVSGQVGSVGVYIQHMDQSKALEKEGVAVSLISAGQFKTEGNSYQPLSDEARSYMESQVQFYYDMFLSELAQGRRTTTAKIRADYGQGRMLTATAALAAGMIDRIESLEETLGRLGGRVVRAQADDAGYGDDADNLTLRAPRLPVSAAAAMLARAAQVERECFGDQPAAAASPPPAPPPPPSGSLEDVRQTIARLDREEREARRKSRRS